MMKIPIHQEFHLQKLSPAPQQVPPEGPQPEFMEHPVMVLSSPTAADYAMPQLDLYLDSLVFLQGIVKQSSPDRRADAPRRR